MDKKLIKLLDKLGILYEIYEHPPFFTVEESKKYDIKIPGLHTKNLFLKNENSVYFLLCYPGDKRVNLKYLRKHLNSKELYFSSPEELKKELNITPGSVSLFSIIYSNSVVLLVDKEVWNSEFVGFHPNINTSTLVISHEGLEKFYNSLNCKKEVLEIA